MTIDRVLTFVNIKTGYSCSERFAKKIKRIVEQLQFIDNKMNKTDNDYFCLALDIATNCSLYSEHEKKYKMTLDFVDCMAILSNTH